MSVKSYRDLNVWRAGINLVEQIYRLTDSFPQNERYSLASQLQRAAVSFPSNIAEGHARSSSKEFLHFLSIALGSLAELETQLFIAQRLGYLDDVRLNELVEKTETLGRMMRGLQKSLKEKVGNRDASDKASPQSLVSSP